MTADDEEFEDGFLRGNIRASITIPLPSVSPANEFGIDVDPGSSPRRPK
jgi:hypothetical protein